MFGYININQKELSDENKRMYQAYYCGLCRKLKEICGRKGQLLLNYDMTFLIVLLTGLYELENERQEFTCALHPTKKQVSFVNEATAYAADMNIILSRTTGRMSAHIRRKRLHVFWAGTMSA